MAFPSFQNKKEKFTIVEIVPTGARITELGLDAERRVRLLGTRFSSSFPRVIPEGKIIFAAHPAFAFTAHVPLLIEREDAQVPLSEPELGHLIGEGVERLLAQCRTEAGKALGRDDTEVTPLTSRVGRFRLDGHAVLDPLGFRGRTFEAAVALTFVVRELAGAIRTAVEKRSFFFTELGKTELMALHKIEDAPVRFVSFEGSEPQFYTLREGSQGIEFIKGKASWPSDSALRILESRFDVSREVAEKIFATYLARDMSLHTQRALDRAFSPAIDAFFGTLVRERMDGRVYVSEERHLPFFLPRSKGKVHLIVPPLHAVLGRHALGIVMSEWSMGEGLLFSRLAPFLEYFGDKNDHRAEHWLNRLFKWKIPTVS